MRLELIKPSVSLNKAFRKTSLKRDQIELFKLNLKRLFDRINDQESEEHLKNIISDFLKDTWYKNLYEINTKGRADLVIHNGKSSSDTVRVIFEVKRPVNKAEMISVEKPNEKALHELLNYYLDERYIKNNKEIKHLIVTNIHDWYIFDGADFERFFFENQKLIKQYKDWHDGLFGVKLNDWFYQEIAKPFIEKELTSLKCTWFNLTSFETIIRNEDKSDDIKLIDLYKTLSPEHLLKKPFANDSNSLDKAFYTELLHIIGLTETKEGSKKLIGRKKVGQRDPGSLIENAIIQIDSRDMISRIVKPSRFGETHQERLFNVSLDLVITWIDRILFLKLLEAQLIKYHKADSSYSFLTSDKIKGYDTLDSLFFRVLAKKTKERDPAVVTLFSNVPYLNSSLFEPTELERETIFISNLQDDCMIPFHPGTVLKNNTGKRLTGALNGLAYLFAFLDAYDFSGEGAEGIQEDNKTLINASVLGLIFEKINGYKDGSFFTPGFITMYMCRETIRRAVVQKFNDMKGWNCENLEELYDKIEDKKEANDIINSLKICDPGVGSGHFLVSSLNEIIAIKSELKILSDKEGKRLKEYHVEVANDELFITDEDGELYEYNPKSPESQRVQEALFHEKQTIIENCLFGVDINPNSVKICRLRLWIELLKNAYYKAESNYTELETLPNIDINIKCGNSLISRYALDADIKQALKKSKWSIDSYRMAVMMYRNATSKEQKREMEQLIESIKTDFETEVGANDKRLLQLKKLNGDLFILTNQTALFEKSKKEQADWNKKINDLTVKIKNLETELEEIKNNKIYENTFEWRFEFPEVLNNEGDFLGFDVVIGNPPYFIMTKQNINNSLLHFLLTNYVSIKNSSSKNIFALFIEKGISILNQYGQQAMIVPEGLFSTRSYADCVIFMNSQGATETITTIEGMIFEEATTGNLIFIFGKRSESKTELFHFNDSQTLVSKQKEDLSVIHKISNADSVILVKDVCELFKGMVVKDRKTVVFTEYNENLKNKFLLGNCISKWKIRKYEYTDFNSLTIIGGTKLRKKHDIFPRILIRRTGDYLCCAYLEEPALTESTLYSCWTKSTDFNNKYILALFHSKLFDYYIKKLMITNKQAFPQILMTDIENLPLKRISDIDQDAFISKIDEILSVKKSDPIANTSIIEKEIDQMVYELYGLTEEEIKIIENNNEK